MLINIISSLKGGGAELLVRELHRIYTGRGIDAHAVYLEGSVASLNSNETILGVNPRSPLNVFRIRKILKFFLSRSRSELIVHVHLTWPFFYVTLASLGLKNIKLIHTEHNTTNRRRNIPFLWIFERLLYARYARIICISDGVNAALAKWVGPKIAPRLVTVHNGSRIYSLVERPALAGRLPLLISVGSLSPRKNFATAIHAIGMIRNEIDSYTIIGEGSERSRLIKLVQSEKLEDKVHLVGWSDVIEANLHAADIQVIPSLWEGFGLVAVEGMSTGLPIVASDVVGLREVLNPSNPSVTLVNSAESVEEWVEGIRKSIADLYDKGAYSLGQSSRKQAEKFTLDKMADNYLSVYNNS